MVEIKIKRLLLRELIMSDWKAVYGYASDPEVVRFMDWGPNSEEETRIFIERSIKERREHPRRSYTLAIVRRRKYLRIGGCGITVSSPENREGWIGYFLNRRFWEKGFGTESATALIEFGFAELNLHRIYATCDPSNRASAHVLVKAGMKREGHLREHRWRKGTWRDSLLYAVLDHEWKGTREL